MTTTSPSHLLEQRADRRDADAAGDQQRPSRAGATASVKTPNGPSATTRVPTGVAPARACSRRRAFTVIRSESPSGAAESENGCAFAQRPRREEAPEEELAGVCVQPVEPAPGDPERDDARAFLARRPRRAGGSAGRATSGSADPEHDEQHERRDVERAPVVGRDRVQHELVAGRDLVEPGERDPGVGESGARRTTTRSGSRRCTITTEVTTTAMNSTVPTVAVIIPG